MSRFLPCAVPTSLIGSMWPSKARPAASNPAGVAFSVGNSEFDALSARLAAECVIWRNDKSEGASTYFLDPDGHKLEIHVGELETRLSHYRQHAPEGMHIFDD